MTITERIKQTPVYKKGDLRRMLSVLGSIEKGRNTLVQISEETALDKKTVTSLITQAIEQAHVKIEKIGPAYRIEDWGPIVKRDGAKKVLAGTLLAEQ